MLLAPDSGAVFSPCRRWRYLLWRQWDEKLPVLNVIGCNPSTAAEIKNDVTASRLVDFAQKWGYGKLNLTNLFAWVATNPADMKEASARGLDVVGHKNHKWIFSEADGAKTVICAWGMNGNFRHRGKEVERTLRLNLSLKLCALKLCKDGTPQHPLYLRGDTKPFLWRKRGVAV